MQDDRLELLSVELLKEHADVAAKVRALAGRLGIQLGWHYILDLVWIMCQLPAVRGRVVLDAGAGGGLLQWMLAELGASVLSVDRLDRSQPSPRLRRRYSIRGLCEGDLRPYTIGEAWREGPGWAGVRSVRALRRAARMVLSRLAPTAGGEVILHRSGLDSMARIEDASIDLVVSVSALEHNQRAQIGPVVDELLRVLKPGGMILATVAAARDEDWFHEPSRGWCLTESSLRRAFRLDAESAGNFAEYDRLFSELRECSELREDLAPFYAQSGENGMPWGVWDPKYHPVGIAKIKRTAA